MSFVAPMNRANVCSTSYRMPQPAGRAAATVTAAWRPAAARRAGVARRPLQQRSRRSAVAVQAVIDVSDATFEQEVLKSDVPVLVDFWATWCGPCKLVAPSMDWAEKEYAGKLKVVKVEADPNPACIERYSVYGLPCLLLFRDGQEVEGSHHEGAVTRKMLEQYIQKHLGLVPASA